VPSLRTQVNHFVRLGVLEESHDNTVRFRDPRVRVFARIREPLHAVNRARLQFVQTQLENRARAAERDSEPFAPLISGVQRRRGRRPTV
jgi:hypothetical protein